MVQAPIQWAVIDGLKKTGVTTIQMDESIDTRDIIMKEELEVDAKETGGSLFDRLCTLGCEVIVKTLKAIEDGTATRTKQDDALSNYAKKLDKSTGNINFTEDAVKIERLIRGLNPWPSAYTHINGKTLKIWDADVVPGKESVEPGVVTEVDKDSFIVQCNNGALKILEVQMEGKKRMTTDAFLRGYQIEEGTKPRRIERRIRMAALYMNYSYYGYGMRYYFDPTYILIIIAAVIALIAQARVRLCIF